MSWLALFSLRRCCLAAVMWLSVCVCVWGGGGVWESKEWIRVCNTVKLVLAVAGDLFVPLNHNLGSIQ